MLKFVLLDNYFPDLLTEVQIWSWKHFKLGLEHFLFLKDKVNSSQIITVFNN